MRKQRLGEVEPLAKKPRKDSIKPVDRCALFRRQGPFVHDRFHGKRAHSHHVNIGQMEFENICIL